MFINASFSSQVLNFINKVGYPIVMKPRLGAASIGVFVIRDVFELDVALASANLDEVEFEQYIGGDSSR